MTAGRPLHVALTGNVASGKSTVAAMFRDRGATIIDADILARRAIAPSTPGFGAVIERFGTNVVAEDGTIDRVALRKRVFNNAAERDALNAIVHPIVGRLREEELREAQQRGDAIVISDIPLLYEVGLQHAFEAVILVDAPEQTRLQRLVHDRKLPEADARSIMAAQMPSAEKRPLATWVIDNDGTRDQLARQVDATWKSLQAASAEARFPITLLESSVSNIPADLRYTKEHEYVKATDEAGVVAIGITDFAQGELGDIVYLELPKVGNSYGPHDVFGTVEAVKAVSELFMPVAGEIVAINDRLDGEPALVNTDPYGDGWMIRVRTSGGEEGLMSADDYKALVG